MADLNSIQASDSTKIVGSDSSGVEQTPVQSTSAGALHTNLRDSSGNELLGKKSQALSIPVVQAAESPTFTVIATSIAIGNNKSMLAIMNGSGSGVTLRIRAIKILNSQTTAVTGVVADFRLRRITTLSAGTSLIPQPHDTSDVLNGSITSATNGTKTDAVGPIDLSRFLYSSDEWGPGTSDVESTDHTLQNVVALYEPRRGEKPITLNPGEGLDIRQLTNSTAGSFDFLLTFTQE